MLPPKPKLTIGMPTFDDFDGVYFTINAIRVYHPEVIGKVQFLVVDNNPDGPHGGEVKKLCNLLPDADYQAVRGQSSSTYKSLVFDLARADHVLCLDCHVLMYPGSIAKLIKFYEMNPDWHDLIQGPLMSEYGGYVGTHMMPSWRGDNFGIWEVDDRGKDPKGDMFEIPMHGMGMFASSVAGWPRYASGMRGFGAEEGTIHEKYRLMGRKCWCFPFLRWLHRFGRPAGVKYRLILEDKVWNYLLAFRESQLPVEVIERYYRDRLPAGVMDEMLHRAEMLPLSPYPKPDFERFLGHPIKILD